MLDKNILGSDGSAGGVQVTLQRKVKQAPYDLEVTVSEQERQELFSEIQEQPLVDTAHFVSGKRR